MTNDNDDDDDHEIKCSVQEFFCFVLDRFSSQYWVHKLFGNEKNHIFLYGPPNVKQFVFLGEVFFLPDVIDLNKKNQITNGTTTTTTTSGSSSVMKQKYDPQITLYLSPKSL